MSRIINIINYIIIMAIFVLCVTLFFVNVCDAGSWANHWTINGVRVSDIDSAKDVATIALGAATSAAVHCAGHHMFAGALGHELEQDGLNEYYDPRISSGDQIAINMGGFITQLAVGTALKKWSPGKFTAGYNAWTAIEVVTYPALFGREDGDLSSGIGDAAYPIFTIWSILNLK